MLAKEDKKSARIMVPEICRRLQVGERAVYAMLEARIIPGMRFGKRWIIGRHAYEKWEKNIGAQGQEVIS